MAKTSKPPGKWEQRFYKALLAGVVLTFLVWAGVIYPYAWPTSGGIVITTPVGCVGFEVYGHVGPFYGRGPGACDL